MVELTVVVNSDPSITDWIQACATVAAVVVAGLVFRADRLERRRLREEREVEQASLITVKAPVTTSLAKNGAISIYDTDVPMRTLVSVVNGSDYPITDVHVTFRLSPRDVLVPKPNHAGKLTIESNATHLLYRIDGGETKQTAHHYAYSPAAAGAKGAGLSTDITVDFIDSAGRGWRRMPDHSLIRRAPVRPAIKPSRNPLRRAVRWASRLVSRR